MASSRTAIYIDGFNLFYAIKTLSTSAKWLDLGELCRVLIPHEKAVSIRYFTADVVSRNDDAGQQIRQQTYLRALKTIPSVRIHKGSFSRRNRWLPRSSCFPYHIENTKVVKIEEKGSDVNLASHLIVDGFKDVYEKAWVLSNDSDLCEPIRLVQKELGLAVGIINPHHYLKRSRKLLRAASEFIQTTPRQYVESQFPDVLKDHNGTIHKPNGW